MYKEEAAYPIQVHLKQAASKPGRFKIILLIFCLILSGIIIWEILDPTPNPYYPWKGTKLKVLVDHEAGFFENEKVEVIGVYDGMILAISLDRPVTRFLSIYGLGKNFEILK